MLKAQRGFEQNSCGRCDAAYICAAALPQYGTDASGNAAICRIHAAMPQYGSNTCDNVESNTTLPSKPIIPASTPNQRCSRVLLLSSRNQLELGALGIRSVFWDRSWLISKNRSHQQKFTHTHRLQSTSYRSQGTKHKWPNTISQTRAFKDKAPKV